MVTISPARAIINDVEYTMTMALIKRADLIIEDHGAPTVSVILDGDGWGQAMPGRFCGVYDKEENKQRGTAYGMDLMLRFMEVVGTDKWSMVQGSRVYILRQDLYGIIDGILDLDAQRYLIFEDHAKRYEAAS